MQLHRNLLQLIATYHQLTATTVPSNVTQSLVVRLMLFISRIVMTVPVHRSVDLLSGICQTVHTNHLSDN